MVRTPWAEQNSKPFQGLSRPKSRFFQALREPSKTLIKTFEKQMLFKVDM